MKHAKIWLENRIDVYRCAHYRRNGEFRPVLLITLVGPDF